MIFGIGEVPRERKTKTCAFRIVPSKILGFSKVQQRMICDHCIHDKTVVNEARDISAINSDLDDTSNPMQNSSKTRVEDGGDETPAGGYDATPVSSGANVQKSNSKTRNKSFSMGKTFNLEDRGAISFNFSDQASAVASLKKPTEAANPEQPSQTEAVE